MFGDTRKLITLGRFERIVAAVPDFAHGPGWSNRPLWVYIVDSTTKILRTECIQPEDQSEEMQTLFNVCNAAHGAMLEAVQRVTDGGS